MPTKPALRTRIRVTRIKRLTNSTSGNPRWLIYDEHGFSARTQTNAAFAHAVGDHLLGREVVVTLNLSGCITSILIPTT